MSHGDEEWLRLGGPDAVAALSVLASLLLFAYTRRGERDPLTVLDLGLAYMVFTAFAPVSPSTGRHSRQTTASRRQSHGSALSC